MINDLQRTGTSLLVLACLIAMTDSANAQIGGSTPTGAANSQNTSTGDTKLPESSSEAVATDGKQPADRVGVQSTPLSAPPDAADIVVTGSRIGSRVTARRPR
jgi:hypothetical protein